MVHDAEQRVGLERYRPRQHLEGDDPERVLVALRASPAAGALLRAHEGGRADHSTVGGEGHVRRPQGDSEIGYHDAPVSIDEDVRALQVPVHDPHALQQLVLVLDGEHQRGLEGVRGPGAAAAAEARVRRHVGAALEALALHGLTWSGWVSVGAAAGSVSIELSRRIVSVALPVFRPISESRPGVRATMDVSDDVMLRCGRESVAPPTSTTTVNATVDASGTKASPWYTKVTASTPLD